LYPYTTLFRSPRARPPAGDGRRCPQRRAVREVRLRRRPGLRLAPHRRVDRLPLVGRAAGHPDRRLIITREGTPSAVSAAVPRPARGGSRATCGRTPSRRTTRCRRRPRARGPGSRGPLGPSRPGGGRRRGPRRAPRAWAGATARSWSLRGRAIAPARPRRWSAPPAPAEPAAPRPAPARAPGRSPGAIVPLDQVVDRSGGVGAQTLRAEEHVPVDGREGLGQIQVVAELAHLLEDALDRLVRRLADVQSHVGVGDLVRPPGHESLVVRGGVAELPVDLWVDVVDPALAHPAQGVRADHVVGLRAGGVRALRVARGVAPDPERADPEPHPGLLRPDPL